MKLKTLRIQNFRSFIDQTISFGDYTCFIGANGAGKSTILTALCVLFRDAGGSRVNLEALSSEDFHDQDVSKPVVITATFVDLSDDAKQELSAYVRHDQLVVTAEAHWKEHLASAPVVQRGERLIMKDFADYFAKEKSGEKAATLKAEYQELRKKHSELPAATSKGDMADALRAYEEANPDLCELQRSDDQFYGWSKGSNKLEKYIQWVFVPAVKDAGDEADETKQSALGQLLARTVRSQVAFDEQLESIRADARAEYEKVVSGQQHVLDSISDRLGASIKKWAHDGADLRVVWKDDDAKAVTIAEPVATMRFSEGPFLGSVVRFGHGLQRSYLLALLQVLAEFSGAEDEPVLLLGIEEPELFQHPPQARHLAGVLAELAGGKSRIAVCTHSPVFVPAERLYDIRLVRRDPMGSPASVRECDVAALADRIGIARGKPAQAETVICTRMHQCLNAAIREMFFARKVVLVEGIEDQAYISAWLHLTERYLDFHRLGGQIVPANGKGFIVEPLALLIELGIPTYVVFDSDAEEQDPDKRRMHESDNRAILRLQGLEDQDPFPERCLTSATVTLWKDQIGARVKEAAGHDAWESSKQNARAKYDLHAKAMVKNPMFIGYALAELRRDGGTCTVLDELCDRIMEFLEA